MEHQHAAAGWLVALEESGVGSAMRSSLWLFPAVEIVHILGFALLVGAIAAYDLRLIRGHAAVAAEPLGRVLLPVAAAGLAIAVPAGLLLFTSEATAFAVNPAFWAKMALLALGLANIAVFHLGVGRSVGWWPARRPPMAARVAGAVSLACWIGVLTCGRLIAYF